MNRFELIAWCRKQGFKGKPTLEEVTAFLADGGHDPEELRIEDGDETVLYSVEKLWKIVPKLKSSVAVADDDDAEDDEQDAVEVKKTKRLKEKSRLQIGNPRLAETEAADDDDSHKGGSTISAKAWVNVAARKAYDLAATAGRTRYVCSDVAEVCAAYSRLKIAGDYDYQQKRHDKDICKKAQVEYDNTLGGSLVPDEFTNYVSRVMTTQGKMKQAVRNVTMSRDVQTFNRRVSGLTVYKPGEGNAITASTNVKTPVELTTSKLATLTTVSSELFKDSAINQADDIAFEINYAFDAASDNIICNGDGTSTYYGFTGLRSAFTNLSATRANIAGAFVGPVSGGGTTFTSLTMASFEGVQGRLPDLNMMGEPSWYVNRRFYWEVMMGLALAVGGVTAGEIEGKRVQMFLGSPVVFVNAMPRVPTVDTVAALYGDASLAATFGVNGGVEIDESKDRYFDQDLIAFRGRKRIAFVPHDIGNASGTEASRTPGPLVALLLGAS